MEERRDTMGGEARSWNLSVHAIRCEVCLQ
eukprot:SAG25_NODE_3_length_30426_cov_8.268210_27_plen_30_part_00